MNKRITTLFLCLVMVVAMLVSAVPVFAETSAHPPVTFTIKPDKTTAKPGDTITYQVFVGPVEKLRTAQFALVIPDELEYTGGSSPDGLKAKLGATSAEYTPDSKIFVLYGNGEYTSTEDTLLATITCKVKEGVAAGKKPVVTVIEDEDFLFADSDSKYYTINYDPNGAAVTIAAAPKPATGISLNKTTLSLTVGGSEQLNATVEPADTTDTVQWSSDNTDVATVDGTGKVTAVGIGTATITAKVGDHTAECTVDVVKTVRIELPYKLVVKKTGEMDPGKETFKFIAERFGAPTNYTLVQDSIMTEGEKTYDGKFIFDIPETMLGNLSEGFRFRQVKGDAAGWTYDEKVYYVVPEFENDGLSGWRFFNADEIPGDPSVSEPAPDVIEELVFTNSYNAKKPVDPPAPQQPEIPKTGDSSMLGLWLALLFVSGAAVATTILIVRMKKTNS